MHLWRSFHVIRQTSMPSVLLEYNFLSNPTLEDGMLARPDYPRRTARAVRRGLEDFLRQRL
jgi:N-acetylmuramoyl-L-alanine amidase